MKTAQTEQFLTLFIDLTFITHTNKHEINPNPKADPGPPHVHLRRFTGLPNENWDQFEGLLQAKFAASRIPEKKRNGSQEMDLHAPPPQLSG